MRFDAPKSINYAAQVVRIPVLIDLPGLDKLAGVPVLGCQALTQKDDTAPGELVVAFTAETQLSDEYARLNDLYRDVELNTNPGVTGYLEKNRRVRAVKFRGHRSDALLMPLSTFAYTGINPAELQEGDVFDTLNGHEICKKYELPKKPGTTAKSKVEKAFRRVDKKFLPEHLETDNYARSKHILDPKKSAISTQKLHGTSIRVGRVPCLREKGWFERLLNRWFPTADHTYDWVPGSRKVIKDVNNPRQDHYYGSDIWTEYGRKIEALVPEGYIVYGELVGWTPDGQPIQKGYTYDLPKGHAELYVYRVATISPQAVLADLSWDGVKEFCLARGLKWTPELYRDVPMHIDGEHIDMWLGSRFAEVDAGFYEQPVPLSDKKTVDEGMVIRQDGIVPILLKAKAPEFLQYETKLLDKGEIDTESAA